MARAPLPPAASTLQKTFESGKNSLRTASDEAERLATKDSSVLVGTLTAFTAVGGAYTLSILVPAVSFFFAGPIAFGIGITGGILLFRGPAALREERDRARRHQEADRLDAKIKKLPKDYPPHLRKALQEEHARLLLPPGQTPSVADQQPQITVLQPQLQLPSPSAPTFSNMNYSASLKTDAAHHSPISRVNAQALKSSPGN